MKSAPSACTWMNTRPVLARWTSAPVLAIGLASAATAQVSPHAGMMRFPDVSAEHIVFVYADDLWLVPRTGGVATPLASPPGPESLPRFSPDGRQIAFVGSYDAGRDLYTVSVDGGVPTRVTHHPGSERLCDWTPDGQLLFFMNALAGRERQDQLFTVPPRGGLPARVGVPYGTFGTISPSGEWLAYTPNSTDNSSWKRYRGGMSTDIWLFNLRNASARRATEWEGTDTQPMWHGGQLAYLSDEGPSHRLNVWSLDPATGKRRQLTSYTDYDARWPAIGPGPTGQGEIVFQHGAELVLLDLATDRTTRVEVTVPGARPTLRAQPVDVADLAGGFGLSPSGKRALVEARGDVWTLPAKDGTPRNLTRTSAVFERDPSWSPDGRWIAYTADASGEYELYVTPADGKGPARALTSGSKFYRGRPTWSPDSKHIVFTDKTGALLLQAVDGGDTKTIDRDAWTGDLLDETPSWSHDSRWLAYSLRDDSASAAAIWLYEVATGAKHQVTAGVFNDSEPVFDRQGDWLYFTSSRSFAPLYGELDTSFVYPGTQVLLAVPLRADVVSPFAAKSDEEEGPDAKSEEKAHAKAKPAAASKKKGAQDKGDAAAPAEEDEDQETAQKPRETVDVELADFERRALILPVDPGLFSGLAVTSAGALVYLRHPVTAREEESTLQLFDFEPDEKTGEHEEKELAADVPAYVLSADGQKILIEREKGVALLDAELEAEEEELSTEGLEALVDPRAEWNQIFQDAWRLQRDFFYDPRMHNVDWQKVHDDYAAMLADCASRGDVGYVIREMISELNVGHAYYSDGASTSTSQPDVGLLGVDWRLDGGAWRIARLHEGAAWDVDARNPLRAPGVNVSEGDWVLAVNSAPLDTTRDPWASFQGLAGRAVTLTVSKKATLDADAREVVVEMLESEKELRYRDWIEKNRAYVDKKTGGKVGYIYVQSTGVDGQDDLVRQFYGQTLKAALIIDERWNNGGQIPTRFIELLNRPVTNYWARRDGIDWAWPPDAHQGPKCMLINGMSGSGGDAFPAYFRMMGLGKLIGTKTWGGLVGLSGNPSLLDGAVVTVPTFGYYEKDGTWGIEGHGVEPDIFVLDDPSLMVDGGDPQLDKAIEHMMAEIQARPYVAPSRPAYPDRSGMGITDSDK